MSSRRLSVKQVEVLARLMAGESVSRADSDLRVTVYALRNRGLVVTPRQTGGGWVVELTEVGREAASTGRVPERLPRPRGRARAIAQPGVAKRGRVVPGAEEWLDWIAAHADRLDPPDQLLHAPSLPERPTEWSELAPYLKNWPATRPPWWGPPADPAS